MHYLQPRSLADAASSTEYLASAARAIDEMRSCGDRGEAAQLLGNAAARLGAEVALMMSVMQETESQLAHHLVLACDPTWCFEYERVCQAHADRWLEYALSHTEPIRASELSTDGAPDVLSELAAQYGFCSTVIVPIPTCRRASPRGMLCLGSSRQGYFEGDGFVAFRVVARAVAMELHEWWISRLGRELIENASLGEADLTLLGFEYNGYGTKEISRRLGLRSAQIDFRFSRISKKLGVPGRAAAARLAAAYGLL